MQVLLQLVCVVCVVGSPASVAGSPGGGFLSPPHLSGRCPSAAACRPGGYSVAICSMWSLSSLYCSGKEREKGSERPLNHPNHAPSLPESRKGAAHPPGSPLPSSKLPMVACFFRKSLQSFLLRPNASMLWMKVLREDRDALGERMARLPLLPPTFLPLSTVPHPGRWDDAQPGYSIDGAGAGPREEHQASSAPQGMSPARGQRGGVPPQQLVPLGWSPCPAHPSCPKVMFSLKRRLSSRSSCVMWHHFSLQGTSQSGTTLSPRPPQDPLSASSRPGPRCWRTGGHREPPGVVLGVG